MLELVAIDAAYAVAVAVATAALAVEPEPERRGDLVREEPRERPRARVDAAAELRRDQPARDRVVCLDAAVVAAGSSWSLRARAAHAAPRAARLRGDEGAEPRVRGVAEQRPRRGRFEVREARLVAHELRDRYVALAALRELAGRRGRKRARTSRRVVVRLKEWFVTQGVVQRARFACIILLAFDSSLESCLLETYRARRLRK